jgi:hypothetical protein
MTLKEKDWRDFMDIVACALDSDIPYLQALLDERKYGIDIPLVEQRPFYPKKKF